MADLLTLGSPTHVVIGATDLDASINWWTGLGFGVTTENTLDSDAADVLFGLAGEVEQVELRVDEAPGGAIWLVQTPRANAMRGTFDTGPYAVELYTTDIEASLALAADLGAIPSGRLEQNLDTVHRFSAGNFGNFGNFGTDQASVLGPDGFVVVFTAAGERHPSVLDIHPEWLHSEIHSIVSTVRNVDTANRFWSEHLDLGALVEPASESGLDQLMKLPQSIGTRTTTLCDEFANPIRYQFIEFNGLTPEDHVGMLSTWPLQASRPLGCFTVANVAAAAAHLFRAGATFGDVVGLGDGCAIGGSKAIWGLDPNGIRFILAGH